MFNTVELIFVATLVKHFGVSVEYLRVLAIALSLCLIFWGLCMFLMVLYSLSGLCIIFLGFVGGYTMNVKGFNIFSIVAQIDKRLWQAGFVICCEQHESEPSSKSQWSQMPIDENQLVISKDDKWRVFVLPSLARAHRNESGVP